MNTAFVLSRHGSFREILEKMGGDKSFMVELAVIRKYAERSEKMFVFSHDSEDFSPMFPGNCKHVRFYNSFLYSLFGWLFVILYARRNDIRLIYAESVSALIELMFVNRLTRAKVVLDYLYLWHLPVTGVKRRLLMMLESFLLGFADYFIVANKDIRKFVGDRGEVLDIGANALLTDLFRNPSPDKRISRLKGRKILFVGRLIRIKDPLTLISAYKEVRKKYPKLHLVVCGDGDLMSECQMAADENVHFMGFAKSMPSIMRSCDMFVLPSLFDASPRALVEAMGSGLPCIATRVGGVPDYLDESCGILIEPANEKMLMDKIEFVLKNPGKARRLGEKARKRIFKDYDLEKNIEMQLDILMKKV